MSLACFINDQESTRTFSTLPCTNAYDSPVTLKPISPTRWLCRTRSVTAVLDQYDAVLTSLEEMANAATSDTATKAACLLDQL